MNQQENSELKVLKFDIGYLFACLPLVANNDAEDGRKALQCIILGDGWMGASFGPAMVIVEKEIFKGCDYLLSVDDVDSLLLHLSNMQAEDENFDVHDFELQIISDIQASAVVNGGDYMHSIKLLDYKRIDLKEADLIAPSTVNFSAIEMPCFNPDLLSLFSRAMTNFKGFQVDYVKILPTGKDAKIYVKMAGDIHGVLMPCYSNRWELSVAGRA